MTEGEAAKFLLIAEFDVRRHLGESYSELPLNIAEAWQLLSEYFGTARVHRLGAGVFTVSTDGDGGILLREMEGAQSMMKPAWEEISRRRFELEKQGMVENRRKPTAPVQSEFMAWAPLIEEFIAKDPAGGESAPRKFLGVDWVRKINAVMAERELGPLVGADVASKRRFYGAIRQVFEDPNVIFYEGTNMYTTLIWKPDRPEIA